MEELNARHATILKSQGRHDQPVDHFYRASAIYNHTGEGKAAAWYFKPTDATPKPTTHKLAAVPAAGSSSHPSSPYSTSSYAPSPARELTQTMGGTARSALRTSDLAWTREALLSHNVIAGAESARLVGGRWRYVPKP